MDLFGSASLKQTNVAPEQVRYFVYSPVLLIPTLLAALSCLRCCYKFTFKATWQACILIADFPRNSLHCPFRMKPSYVARSPFLEGVTDICVVTRYICMQEISPLKCELAASSLPTRHTTYNVMAHPVTRHLLDRQLAQVL